MTESSHPINCFFMASNITCLLFLLGPPLLSLFFWVELSLSSLFSYSNLSLFHCTPFSVLQVFPGFETMHFLVRLSGLNPITNLITCIVLYWEVALSKLPFVICKTKILSLPLVVLVWILSEVMHENYFEIWWFIIFTQDVLVTTSAHTFNLFLFCPLALNCSFLLPSGNDIYIA